jgi:hypothetical protein
MDTLFLIYFFTPCCRVSSLKPVPNFVPEGHYTTASRNTFEIKMRCSFSISSWRCVLLPEWTPILVTRWSSYLPGMPSKCYDRDKLPVAPIIIHITFAFIFNMRCVLISRSNILITLLLPSSVHLYQLTYKHYGTLYTIIITNMALVGRCQVHEQMNWT